jgi:hypothetical protein
MGFTPNVSVLNHFRVGADPGAKTFVTSITDGGNRGKVFEYAWSDPGHFAGQTMFGLAAVSAAVRRLAAAAGRGIPAAALPLP